MHAGLGRLTSMRHHQRLGRRRKLKLVPTTRLLACADLSVGITPAQLTPTAEACLVRFGLVKNDMTYLADVSAASGGCSHIAV